MRSTPHGDPGGSHQPNGNPGGRTPIDSDPLDRTPAGSHLLPENELSPRRSARGEFLMKTWLRYFPRNHAST